MKTFSRAAGVALLTILALQGCSTGLKDRSQMETARKQAQPDPTKARVFHEVPKNPSVPSGGSIEEFSVALNDKRYYFDVRGRISTPSLSGERTEPQKVFKGLTIALAPAEDHCKRAGGVPIFAELLQPYWVGTVPQRILCQRDAVPLWALDIRYLRVTELEFEPYLFVGLTLRTELLPPERYAIRLKEEQAQAQAREAAATAQREAQAVLEQERQQRVKEAAAERQRIAAQQAARVATFQANLKPGDRFQWARSPGGGGPFVGMVVRIEGALAFVQFDNLTIAGQQTRYVPKVELEPFDWSTQNLRRVID
jgi:signal transduction histidine kinase